MNVDTIQIHFNTKYANKINGSSSNVEFYLPMIEIPLQHYMYLSLQSAFIPYSFYNIDSSNNTLILVIDGNTLTYTIPVGNYNAYQLQLTLNTFLVNLIFVYNIVTNKFTINYTEDFTISENSTCLKLLGLRNNLTSISKILISDGIVNLLNKMCICIHSNLQTGNISTNDNKYDYNIIASIPVNSQPYSLISYTNVGNAKSCIYTNTLSYIKFQLKDQDGHFIDLNGCDWSCVIQLDVFKFVE
jgi:hypothetical protein